jgi:hypothetical protein
MVARQFIAWKASNENPSRRARSDPYPRLISRPNGGSLLDPIIPFPTGRNFFVLTTRHFVPGYLHNVPTGQRHFTTVHIFEATSLRVAGFEDEDESASLPREGEGEP